MDVILTRSIKIRYTCPITDFGGNNFSFQPINMMLTIDLSSLAFILFMHVPSVTNFFTDFNIKECCIYSEAFLIC